MNQMAFVHSWAELVWKERDQDTCTPHYRLNVRANTHMKWIHFSSSSQLARSLQRGSPGLRNQCRKRRKTELPDRFNTWEHLKVKVFVTQSCLTLATPWLYSLSGSSVHGILQARILELPLPFPRDLPDPGIELRSPALQADSTLSDHQRSPRTFV